MRRTVLALAAFGAITAAGSSSASAAVNYPYCLQTPSYGTECNYTSYNQCMASASGRIADCIVNPIIGFAQQQAPQKQRRTRRVYDY
jgi:hypothetical protein